MKGLIFIPDISGFTNFVKSIDSDLGVSITSDLLNEIIDNNPLNLQLSEIEGDAVLFYKIGNPLPLQQILHGFKNMYEAFNNKFQQWKNMHAIEADLSLKLIVHYGNITVYDIKGFTKLYGETVIESHNLLKNDSNSNDYILITEDYMNALHHDIEEVLEDSKGYTNYRSQIISGVKKIAYYFFSSIKKAKTLSKLAARQEYAMEDEMYLAVGI